MNAQLLSHAPYTSALGIVNPDGIIYGHLVRLSPEPGLYVCYLNCL